MSVLGLHLSKGQFRYSVLSGTRQAPVLEHKGRIETTDPELVPALMDWYETQFQALLDQHQPAKLAYRLTLEPTKEQLFCSEFPLGILNLLAHKRCLPIREYTSPSFVPSKLGLPKQMDLYAHCDTIFGKHPPYWDDSQKHSLLVAWFEL